MKPDKCNLHILVQRTENKMSIHVDSTAQSFFTKALLNLQRPTIFARLPTTTTKSCVLILLLLSDRFTQQYLQFLHWLCLMNILRPLCSTNFRRQNSYVPMKLWHTWTGNKRNRHRNQIKLCSKWTAKEFTASRKQELDLLMIFFFFPTHTTTSHSPPLPNNLCC